MLRDSNDCSKLCTSDTEITKNCIPVGRFDQDGNCVVLLSRNKKCNDICIKHIWRKFGEFGVKYNSLLIFQNFQNFQINSNLLKLITNVNFAILLFIWHMKALFCVKPYSVYIKYWKLWKSMENAIYRVGAIWSGSMSCYLWMGLLPDTNNCGLCMRQECWERFFPPPTSKDPAR